MTGVHAGARHGFMRIDFDPQAMGAAAFYRLLTAVVVPRPIAWVSTAQVKWCSNGFDQVAG
jgi:hypothetical protein